MSLNNISNDYQFLSNFFMNDPYDTDLLWHKQVPLKVSILHGASCVIGYQQKQIWLPVALFLWISTYVCQDVVALSRLNTYSTLDSLLLYLIFVC
jgi:hypothetical protein